MLRTQMQTMDLGLISFKSHGARSQAIDYEILLSHDKNEISSLATNWVQLETILLSEIRIPQKTNINYFP